MAVFISRNEKAEWGFPCNQSADGELWAGKGYAIKLEEMFDAKVAEAVAKALKEHRDNRMGRFWIHPGKRTVTMMVLESHLNKYKKAQY
jgi:hypothetical protein